jgi:predicted dehydrogenase
MLVAEVLIHHLDTLRMLLGRLQVTAAQLSRSSGLLAGEDGAVIQLRTDGGAGVAVFASFAAHGHPAAQVDRLEILGDQGAIRLDGPSLKCSGTSPGERTYDLAGEYQGSYDRTIAHFVSALRDNTPFETAPPHNLQTFRHVDESNRQTGSEAMRRSHSKRRPKCPRPRARRSRRRSSAGWRRTSTSAASRRVCGWSKTR